MGAAIVILQVRAARRQRIGIGMFDLYAPIIGRRAYDGREAVLRHSETWVLAALPTSSSGRRGSAVCERAGHVAHESSIAPPPMR